MPDADIYTVVDAVRRHARPDRSHDEVIRAVRGEHPDLTRADVLNAAFLAIAIADQSPEDALRHGV